MENISMFLIVALLFAGLDAAWLKVSRPFYAKELHGYLRARPRLGVAAVFYVLYVIGVVVFAVAPAVEAGSIVYALGYGALFGLVTYATYDLTNLATLDKWSQKVVIVDMAWGVAVTAVASTVAYLVLSAWAGV